MSRFWSCAENVQLSSFLGLQTRLGFCRISAGLRTGPIRALPGSVPDPPGTRPGHAPELVFVLKRYNCRHFRCLCCFGPALALVWGIVCNIFYGICQDSAHVLKTCNRPHFQGFGLVWVSAGSLPGSVPDLSGPDPSRTRPGLVWAMPRNCFLS